MRILILVLLTVLASPLSLLAKDYSGVYKNVDDGNIIVILEKSDNVYEVGCKFGVKSPKDIDNFRRDELNMHYFNKRIEEIKMTDKDDKKYQKYCKTLGKVDPQFAYVVNFKNIGKKKLDCLYFQEKFSGKVENGYLRFGSEFSSYGDFSLDGNELEMSMCNAQFRRSGFDCDVLAGKWIKK